MDITFRVDKDILYIAVSGRIDASNAAAAEEKILAIKAENKGKHTVVDADHLEYISSAAAALEASILPFTAMYTIFLSRR